ncbi:MAG: phosphomannomutase/phosphoglucomutase [Betaproteobacteria bacterium]|nr:phosphomannomutase/phosphoglucomutase [Betaproteobacteria bacterium]
MSFVPAEIFRAYDIRGIVGSTLTPRIVHAIGQALGTLALETGGVAGGKPTAIAVGRDGRLSGPALSAALAEGIADSGANVIDVGMVPTPVTYFAAHYLGCGSAVMLTGSHNPPEYNGIKMVIAGNTLSGDAIQNLRKRIAAGEVARGAGTIESRTVANAYLARIVGDVKLGRPMKIAIDCGNGVAGELAPMLFRQLGCAVTELFCEVDGNFPNHHPDPSQPKNLADLIAAVKNSDAELGLAFDGDGDRLGVVTKDGKVIFPDRQLMLYAADVLSRNPGATIIFDVKSTRLLAPWIEKHGGVPLIWKTGHSFIKAKLRETGGLLAGEMSGHTFFKERWYGFDDALYTGARLLEIVSRGADPSAILNALPDSLSTPELNWMLAEGEPHALVDKLQKSGPFPNAERILTIDGVRAEYKDGFGLARASNTTPVIVLRFEADNAAALARIQAEFRAALQALKPGAALPF